MVTLKRRKGYIYDTDPVKTEERVRSPKTSSREKGISREKGERDVRMWQRELRILYQGKGTVPPSGQQRVSRCEELSFHPGRGMGKLNLRRILSILGRDTGHVRPPMDSLKTHQVNHCVYPLIEWKRKGRTSLPLVRCVSY